MSFGFSVGDFVAAANLIRDLVSSLRDSSTSEYRELIAELDTLQRALRKIEQLKCHPSRQAALDGVKIAALMCQYKLDEFGGKLKKFESLAENGKKLGSKELAKLWGKKLKWGFTMAEEVNKLRIYLMAHVGSLNMHLITQGLATSAVLAQRAEEGHADLLQKVESSHLAVLESRKDIETYGTVTRSNNSILRRLAGIMTGELPSQLKMLVDLASKIWQSNLQIINHVVKIQALVPSPETRYTWAQEPVRFEDALGRVFPIPSEYGWDMIESAILGRFKSGPGHEKVYAGEYEVFNSFDSTQSISGSEVCSVTPGMSITMAIIVGLYRELPLKQCPRIGCMSLKIQKHEAGGQTCSVCHSWFDVARKPLPRPFRPPEPNHITSSFGANLEGSKKRKRSPFGNSSGLSEVHNKMRSEHRGFKIVRILYTHLPATPFVSNIRSQHHWASRPEFGVTSGFGTSTRKRQASYLEAETDPIELRPSKIRKAATDIFRSPALTGTSSLPLSPVTIASKFNLFSCPIGNQSTVDKVWISSSRKMPKWTNSEDASTYASRHQRNNSKLSRISEEPIQSMDDLVTGSGRSDEGHLTVDGRTESKGNLGEGKSNPKKVPSPSIHPKNGGASDNELVSGSISDSDVSTKDHATREASPYSTDMNEDGPIDNASAVQNVEPLGDPDPIPIDTGTPAPFLVLKPPSAYSEPQWIGASPAPSTFAAVTAPADLGTGPLGFRAARGVQGAFSGGLEATSTVIKPSTYKKNRGSSFDSATFKLKLDTLPVDSQDSPMKTPEFEVCLRCSLLGKTCDKREPCFGCHPSPSFLEQYLAPRLWQVPCARVDIKDLGYFIKGWTADYERSVSLGISVGNLRGYSEEEKLIYITHGYGTLFPVMAREVFVRDNKAFWIDWVETIPGDIAEYEVETGNLSVGLEGVSVPLLSEYLDHLIDNSFEEFIDNYYQNTAFISDVLKSIHQFHSLGDVPIIRKALKFLFAYNLTLHITFAVPTGDMTFVGKIDDIQSMFYGHTVAPVMINTQVKFAMADMWRLMQKEVLAELSALYTSLIGQKKIENWPFIFILTSILLLVWEQAQWDSHFRIPDENDVHKFCSEMESTPVSVAIGLFHAISEHLPPLVEWSTARHGGLLKNNEASCNFMADIARHIARHEEYLYTRDGEAKFHRQNFASLSNKFLSRLVLRTT